jgi:hypothetical protein
MVPKGLEENLQFRREVLSAGTDSEQAARELEIACIRDILFYVNTFVWTYDPRRPRGQRVVPFITWDYQDDVILELAEAFGVEDRVLEKSRDMGASWMCVIVFEHAWHFHNDVSGLLLSRKQELVDKPDNPKSLFGKIDFMHRHQPGWLLPRRRKGDRTFCHLYNPERNSVLAGEATTGDMGRGDRLTGALLDEYAAVQNDWEALSATRDATNCRFFNSTHQGQQTAFYALTKRKSMVVVKLPWTLHPEKSAGLYQTGEDGQIEVLDEDYEYPEDFEFRTDTPGKKRSPFYDHECDRAAHPLEIAQELDMDPMGSSYQFFDPASLEKVIDEYVEPPLAVGDIDYDPDTARPEAFMAREKGPLKLWRYLQTEKRPRPGTYVIGCDVSQGTGASNSCASIGDVGEQEKIGEYVSSDMAPERFAKVVVALARFFHDALIIWEGNGPGMVFGDMVIELGYRRIYYRESERDIAPKPSSSPGWFSSAETKLVLLGQYRRVLGDPLINRSREALEECKYYVFLSTGKVEHSEAANTLDSSGARENHGDRVIADALLWRGMSYVSSQEPQEREIPSNSLAGRRQKRRKRAREEQDPWR